MTDLPITYGQAILSKRSLLRLTQDDVAKAAGIMRSTLIDIEYERIEITENTYNKILAAMQDQPI